MTTSTRAGWGGVVRAGGLLSVVLLVSACTRSGDPTMGMTPPASIGGGGLDMPPVSETVAPGRGMVAQSPAPADMRSQTPAPALATAPAPAPATTFAARQGSPQVQFLPVVGAPPEKVAMLSEALSRSASERGVTILASGGDVAPFRLKGYLSALGEGDETIVVYVWDVVDPSGNRVSRIQGQERVGASGTEPWDSVGESALTAIAGRTIDEFLASASAAG